MPFTKLFSGTMNVIITLLLCVISLVTKTASLMLGTTTVFQQ